MTISKPLFAIGMMSLSAVLLGTPAGAAQTCDRPVNYPPDLGYTCTTVSTDTVVVEQSVPGTTDLVETIQTRYVVKTPDGTAFDQSVNDAPGSAPAAEVNTAAREAATSNGLSIVSVTTSPATRTLVTSTEEEVTTLDREETSVQVELTIGPGTAQVGPDRSETIVVANGNSLINSNTRTTRYVNVATKTTSTYRTSVTITIVAAASVGPTVPTSTTTSGVPAVAPAATDTPSGELARTGGSSGRWTVIGISLLITGAGFLRLSRRTAGRDAPGAR